MKILISKLTLKVVFQMLSSETQMVQTSYGLSKLWELCNAQWIHMDWNLCSKTTTKGEPYPNLKPFWAQHLPTLS